jgi:hypothetical protein
MVKNTGHKALRSEQFLMITLIPKKYSDEQIVIHHVTADTPEYLQLEIERRSNEYGISFERIII